MDLEPLDLDLDPFYVFRQGNLRAKLYLPLAKLPGVTFADVACAVYVYDIVTVSVFSLLYS